MSDEVLEHIFEPFFTTKPQGKGTGLGLPMVFGAIQQNSGFISVSSKIGRGTRFDLYLPRSKGISQSLPAVRVPSPLPTGHEHILLVEDDPSVRVLTQRMLSHLGYTVTTCANGAEALTVARTREAFELLLTDIILPDLNGRILAMRLAELRPTLKVLYVSGYTEDVIAHQGVVEEGLAFLGKPFTIEELAHKLRSVLEQT